MINPIDGPRPLQSASPTRRKGKAGETGRASFSEHLGASDESSVAANIGPLGAVSGVLDIQEVDDALSRAARGKLRAEDLLDRLDDLRMDLLSGTLSRTKLQRLADVVRARRVDVSDPRLGEILDEIDLRAQVELAKFNSV